MKISNINKRSKIYDIIGGCVFASMTLIFFVVFLTNDGFFTWAFNRHHNLLSWYIRPLFILPILYFSYKRSWSGIMASIFGLFTSMFWFPMPFETSSAVKGFLSYEMDYLKGTWTLQKILLSLSVPLFFITLITAAWWKSWKVMLIAIVSAAILKVIWSAIFAGPEGLSILKPAITGLVICIGAIYFYSKRRKKVS